MPKRAGFTLLELLLVIVLIGILASVVVVNFTGDSTEEQVNKEAVRFQQVFQFIAETAQLRQQEWGLVVSENSYAFAYFDNNGWHWADELAAAKQHTLPEGLNIQLELDGLPGAELNLLSQLEWQQDDEAADNTDDPKAAPPLPKVFMLSSGEISPFRLTIIATEGVQEFQVRLGTDFSIPLIRFTEDDN